MNVGVSTSRRIPPTPVPPSEREMVAAADADATFGAKNHFIMDRFWGYGIESPPPAMPTWTPPPPKKAEVVPVDPLLEARSRTFDQIVTELGQASSVSLESGIKVVGASADELDHIHHAIESIPPNARAFLGEVKAIYVADVPVFKAWDGTLSTITTGVSDNGRMIINRTNLRNFQALLKDTADASERETARKRDAEDWFNCITHELAHFEDYYLRQDGVVPSRAADSPMGQGRWFTNYAWFTQDKSEDLAEGYALLARRRWEVLHPGETP